MRLQTLSRSSFVLAMVFAVGAAGAARAQTPAGQLHAILHEFDGYYAENDPIGAGQRGDLRAAALWPDDSEAADARRQAVERALKLRLDAVPASALSGEDALNRDLLERELAIDLEGYRFDESRIPFTNDEGFFLTPGYAAEGVRIQTSEQAQAWLHRIATLPEYYAREIADMRRGIATGFVSPRITASTVAKATRAQADLAPDQSPLLGPFDALPPAMQPAEGGAARPGAGAGPHPGEAGGSAAGRLLRRRLPAPRPLDPRRLRPAGRPRLLPAPGAPGDHHRSHARPDLRARPARRSRASARPCRWRSQPPASPGPSRSSCTSCAPTRSSTSPRARR